MASENIRLPAVKQQKIAPSTHAGKGWNKAQLRSRSKENLEGGPGRLRRTTSVPRLSLNPLASPRKALKPGTGVQSARSVLQSDGSPRLEKLQEGLKTAIMTVRDEFQASLRFPTGSPRNTSREYLQCIEREQAMRMEVNAVEEILSNTRKADCWLYPSHRCLQWAEKKAREQSEALRQEMARAEELRENRRQSVRDKWGLLVQERLTALVTRALEAVRAMRNRQIAAAVNIQQVVRGWLDRKNVKLLRKKRRRQANLAATVIQSMWKGEKDRKFSSFLQKMDLASTTHARLFEAQRVFRQFDRKNHCLVDQHDMQAALALFGIPLSLAEVQNLLDSLSKSSRYKRNPTGRLCFTDFCELLQLKAGRASCEKMQMAMEVFQFYDQDHSGRIEEHELKVAVEELSSISKRKVLSGDVASALRFGRQFGGVSFEVFVALFDIDTGGEEASKDDTMDAAWRVFEKMDGDGDGRVTVEEMASGALGMLGVAFSDEDCRILLEEAHATRQGAFTFPQFCNLVGISELPEHITLQYDHIIGSSPSSPDRAPFAQIKSGKGMRSRRRATMVVGDSRQTLQRAASSDEGFAPELSTRRGPRIGMAGECAAVEGLRVKPTLQCLELQRQRSLADKGHGIVVLVIMGGLRVLVEHEDESERYYSTGHRGIYDLELLPVRFCHSDREEAVFWKAQPHLKYLQQATSRVRAIETHEPLYNRARRFDHLEASLRAVAAERVRERRGAHSEAFDRRAQAVLKALASEGRTAQPDPDSRLTPDHLGSNLASLHTGVWNASDFPSLSTASLSSFLPAPSLGPRQAKSLSTDSSARASDLASGFASPDAGSELVPKRFPESALEELPPPSASPAPQTHAGAPADDKPVASNRRQSSERAHALRAIQNSAGVAPPSQDGGPPSRAASSGSGGSGARHWSRRSSLHFDRANTASLLARALRSEGYAREVITRAASEPQT